MPNEPFFPGPVSDEVCVPATCCPKRLPGPVSDEVSQFPGLMSETSARTGVHEVSSFLSLGLVSDKALRLDLMSESSSRFSGSNRLLDLVCAQTWCPNRPVFTTFLCLPGRGVRIIFTTRLVRILFAALRPNRLWTSR